MAIFVATAAAAEVVVLADAAVGGIAVACFERSSADSDPPDDGCPNPDIDKEREFATAGFI